MQSRLPECQSWSYGEKNGRIAWPIKIAIAKTLTKAKALNPVAIAKAKTSMTELNECAPFQQDSTCDLRQINALDKYLTMRDSKQFIMMTKSLKSHIIIWIVC